VSLRFTLLACLSALAACATDAVHDGPDFDGEILELGSGDGKADGPQRSVQVRARTSGYRGADEYGSPCYDTGYEIEVSYKNEALPWGVSLELVSAVAGVEWWPDDVNNVYHYDYFDWKYEERAAAPSVAPWTWRAARSAAGYSGGGDLDRAHFAMRIRYADGSVRWDNGGSAWGYYEIDLPAAPCEPSWVPYQTTTPTTWLDLTPRVVAKW
jgi:hypothetical protein